MNNAERFKQIFGFYATELWSMNEVNFLRWLNAEAPNLIVKPMELTNEEILKMLEGE